MQSGTLLAAAKRDGSGAVTGSLVLVAVCAGVLALNWKYVYNWFAGPFPFTAALAADPGPREWVRAEGAMVDTGVVQKTTVRLLRGLAENERVSAQYMAMPVEGKLLIVKVEPDFSGRVVEGRLEPLPETVRSSAPANSTHSWLVDATNGYRWDFNLFVMIAGPLFPLTVLLLGYSAWKASNVERHSSLARLEPFGPPRQVLQQVESDVMMAGDKARVGSIWLTPKWLVVTDPDLIIVPAQDLIGIGHHVKTTKSGPEHSVYVWIRDTLVPERVKLLEAQAREVIAKASTVFPWAVVPNTAEFEKAWSRDRGACARDADARRGGKG